MKCATTNASHPAPAESTAPRVSGLLLTYPVYDFCSIHLPGLMRTMFCGIILGNLRNFKHAPMKKLAVLALIAALAVCAALAAHAQPKPAGDAKEGRALALEACTGCHIVAADQPFKPIYVGDVRPLDFKDIAYKPGVTADSLVHYLDTLPTIPKDSQMANADLTPEQTRDVVAYILSLRDKQPAQTH